MNANYNMRCSVEKWRPNFLEERQLPSNKYFVIESEDKIKSSFSGQAGKTKAEIFDPQCFGD